MSYDLGTQIWVQEHIEQMPQEAKEVRLLRSKDPRASQKRQSSVMQVFRSLSCLFTRCPDVRPAPQ